MLRTLLSVTALCFVIYEAYGTSEGPLKSACFDLEPGHQVKPQSGHGPYTLQATISGSDPTVKLSGINGALFKGYMIRINGGHFPHTSKQYTYLSCNDFHDTVGHSEASEKGEVVIPFALNEGSQGATFMATVVESYATYYMGLQASV